MHTNFEKIVVLLLAMVAGTAQAQLTDPLENFCNVKKTALLSTGIRMKYIDTGNPNGTPLIFLHGYTDTSRSFKLIIIELMKINKNFRIIAPDLRGHGGSSMPPAAECAKAPEECFTQKQFAEDIISLIDVLQLGQVSLIGHSMGSMVAQTLALEYPERIQSMVLIGTLVNGRENSATQDFLIGEIIEKSWKDHLQAQPDFEWPAGAYWMTPNDLESEFTQFLRDLWVVEPYASNELIQAIYPETVRTRLGTWIGAIKSMGSVDYSDRIEKLNLPVLILWATQDSFMIEEDQQKVKEAFGRAASLNGNTVLYKTYGKRPLPDDGSALNELGHNLQWAAPAEVATDVDHFITAGYVDAVRVFGDQKKNRKLITTEADQFVVIRLR